MITNEQEVVSCEHHSISAALSSSESTHAQQSCVTEMFAAAAIAHADRTALSYSDGELSYRELDLRTSGLARYLRTRGIGRNDLVGLCVPRSNMLAVGALAVLKAGGAYLPMDPATPVERLKFMIADAGISLLLTSSCQCVPADAPCDVARIDSLCNEIAENPEFEFWKAQPDDLAYVIYTSGSTGRPKGVEITHRGLLNLIQWHQCAFAVSSNDRASMIANVAFDASVWELWPYILSGATLFVADEDTVRAPESLRDWMLAHKVTIGFVPTPMAERLIKLEWPASSSLRFLLTGGDVLHQYPPAGVPFRVVNNYGPTENTVVATSGIVLANDEIDTKPSIGRPIDNTQIYILDEALRPVPQGEAGELYIGGASLARGYRNSPELTRERFISNPFSGRSGDCLYRSGDLACQLPNGEITFLGRVDDQIKIRGHRIEPNEIATRLDTHPAVESSFVIAGQKACADKHLLAYIVLRPGACPSVTELNAFLGAFLPEYMLPSAYVRTKNLPLTANGKVDRAALPLPDEGNILREEDFVAPRTEMEIQLTGILASLLGLERVGMNDNFFLLGGHSLLGAQVIARIQQVFGVQLKLRNLFSNPTVAAMSAEIQKLMIGREQSLSENVAG